MVKSVQPHHPLLTDKWAIQRADTTELCTKTKWKCTFSRWQYSTVGYKVNRVFVLTRTHRICEKYIWSCAEKRKPSDRPVVPVEFRQNSWLSIRTTWIHRQRIYSSTTSVRLCWSCTRTHKPSIEWHKSCDAESNGKKKNNYICCT